jgi:hypothetical protein
MTDPDQRHPAMLGIDQPSVARMYDYYLGGSHNFAADRRAARQAIGAAPEIMAAAHANRAFLGRVVRFAVSAGIGQFLDLGAGLPTWGCVHEVAHEHDPAARVVYVDHDPIVEAYLCEPRRYDPRVRAVRGLIERLDALLVDKIAHLDLIDLDRPVAVLLVSVAHFIGGDIPSMLAPLRRLPPGSLLAISHATSVAGPDSARKLADLRDAYHATPSDLFPRTETEILAMFDGFPLVPADAQVESTSPGRLVPVNTWRTADRQLPIAGFLAGVGLRPPPPATPAELTDGQFQHRSDDPNEH